MHQRNPRDRGRVTANLEPILDFCFLPPGVDLGPGRPSPEHRDPLGDRIIGRRPRPNARNGDGALVLRVESPSATLPCRALSRCGGGARLRERNGTTLGPGSPNARSKLLDRDCPLRARPRLQPEIIAETLPRLCGTATAPPASWPAPARCRARRGRPGAGSRWSRANVRDHRLRNAERPSRSAASNSFAFRHAGVQQQTGFKPTASGGVSSPSSDRSDVANQPTPAQRAE